MRVPAFGGVKATTVATQRERRKHCGRTPDCRKLKDPFWHRCTESQEKQLAHILSVSVFRLHGLRVRVEQNKKCALHRQVCQNTKMSSSSLMCVCVRLCVFVGVGEGKGGSASCWGLGHA